MQELRRIGFELGLAAFHDEQVLLRGDVDFVGFEPGDGKRDAVLVIAAAFDVERGVIVPGLCARLALQQVEQAVETDGGAAIGGKIETCHWHILV